MKKTLLKALAIGAMIVGFSAPSFAQDWGYYGGGPRWGGYHGGWGYGRYYPGWRYQQWRYPRYWGYHRGWNWYGPRWNYYNHW
jgi:hypothetical protein